LNQPGKIKFQDQTLISRLEIAIDEKTAHENNYTLLNSRTSLIDSPGIDDTFKSEQFKALFK
jgi:hypothetical protein